MKSRIGSTVQRRFIIGDIWLYYKLYTGPKTADMVLTKIINPVAKELLENNFIKQWFFIRYKDPKHHLRVRFQSSNSEFISEIVNKFHEPFKNYIDQDLLWKVQLDTYQRELERYGKNTIELAEKQFFYDSTMISNFLSLIEGEEGEEIRWLFGLRAIENLLNVFQYTDEGKLNLLEILKTNFGNEFGMSRFLKKQLDVKYRSYREKISKFMVLTPKNNPDFIPLLDLLDTNAKGIKSLATKILHYEKNKTLQMELNNLMNSYIHMLMNRLFKSNNRLNEMVCYDFLYRYYKSEWAMKKYGKG